MPLQFRFTRWLILIVGLFCVLGCGSGTEPAPEETVEPETAGDVEAETGQALESEFLPYPYEAAEIRDTMTLGFEADTLTEDGSGKIYQRWTVVEWDEDSVVIAYTPINELGVPTGEPVMSTSTWKELQEHAKFAKANSTRTRERRLTDLGEREGWLYEVVNPNTNAKTWFFFADAFPGAPIWMQTIEEDRVVMTMKQIRRTDG